MIFMADVRMKGIYCVSLITVSMFPDETRLIRFNVSPSITVSSFRC